MKKIIVFALVFFVLLFTFLPVVQAHPDDPVYATVQRVKNLILKAIEPLEQKVDDLSHQIENLDFRVNRLEQPQSATLSAVLREEVIKVINEEEAINSLRSLLIAQDIYFKEDTDSNGTFDYAPAPEILFKTGRLIDIVLGTGKKQGYTFILSVKPQNIGWEALAIPRIKSGINRTGDRAFFVDETGVIRATTSDASPSASSEPLNN